MSTTMTLTKTLGQQIAQFLHENNRKEQIIHLGTKLEVEKAEGNESPHKYNAIQLCAKLHPRALDGIHVFGMIEDDCNNERWPIDLPGYVARTNGYAVAQGQLLKDGNIGTRYDRFPESIQTLDDLIAKRTIAFRTSDYLPNIPSVTLKETNLHQACIQSADSELAEHAVECLKQSILAQLQTGRDYLRWK